MPDYWMPFVRCKTQNCIRAKPIFLPYPNPPEATLNQPQWPTDTWEPFLICKHCGRGYKYTSQDVGWRSSAIPSLPSEIFVLYLELKCAHVDCELPVKLYLYSDSAMTKKYRDTKLQSGSHKAKCRAGHGVAPLLEIRKAGIANEIK